MGKTFGVAVLTAFAGAVFAGFLTYKCIEWYGLRRHDGGDLLYFIVFVPLGLLCGLAAGVVVSRAISGFWPSLGVALAGLLGLSAIIALVARTFGEVAPEFKGDQLMLQVELKYPAGWQPDNDARRWQNRSCRLLPVGPGHRVVSPIPGTVYWENASQSDGQWIVPCSVRLISSREVRLVEFQLGKDLTTFVLDLPPDPTAANTVWSQWITDGFSQEDGQPPPVGYAYRCRVRTVNQLSDEYNAARTAFLRQREDAARSIAPDDPIERWLPLFEDPGGVPADDRWGGQERMERKAVAARVLELAPLLTSKDRTLMRQSVFALGSLFETPRSLVPPLLVAGRLTLDLIEEAKSQPPPEQSDDDPGTEALRYFGMWSRAVHNAGPVEAPEIRVLLQDIQHETPGRTGDLRILGNKAKEIERALPPSAPAK